MAKQNSKALREERRKASARVTYIGTASALVLVGLVGLVLWLVNYSPNLTVYKVGDYEVKKDLYTCTYYYNTMTSQEWSKYGFDVYKDPFEQEFDYDASGKQFDTWGAYFEDLTNSTLKFMVVMQDTAQKGGYTYTDEVQSSIDAELTAVEGEKGSASFKEYMLSTYGAEISKKTFREYLQLYHQATAFYKSITESKALFNKYIGGGSDSFEETYEQNRDKIDVVSFRYYTMLENSTNAEKIQALKAAKSQEEFQSLCNSYADDESYTEDDKSLYKNASIYQISRISDSVIAEKILSDESKAGDIYSATYEKDGKNVAEIVYVVTPRGKNTSAYNESDVQQWEFAAMSIMLEEYYEANYTTEVAEKGIEEFRKQMIIPQQPDSTAQSTTAAQSAF